MITKPPKQLAHAQNPLSVVLADYPEHLEHYLNLLSPTDNKGRYLHFEEWRFRFPKEVTPDLAWHVVKMARNQQLTPVIALGDEADLVGKWFLTHTIQTAITEADRYASTAALEWICSRIGEEKHVEFLLNDLIEDEAISSSQLEGAATTTKVAKALLKREQRPKNTDEKMIIGNFKLTQLAWESRHKPLSITLIEDMHHTGMESIDDAHYTPGIFRNTNDIEVADQEGNTVHTPPPAEGLHERLTRFCAWVNNAAHHQPEHEAYLHPLIKAIIIHFVIGFEHPFRDGNGRVARALFYWYLFKHDYSAFRYISISLLLKKAAIKYGKSYLYTETDDLDLTYFIDYQCSVIIRAIGAFKNAYEKTQKEVEVFNQWLWSSGLYKKLSEKQRTVFQVARSGIALTFTATQVAQHLGCAQATATKVLNGLVAFGLFEKRKEESAWVYVMRSHHAIISTDLNKFPF